MDSSTLADIAERIALRDVWNNKGRIIVSDFIKEVADDTVTRDQILYALREHKPNYTIETPMENIIFVILGPSYKEILPGRLKTHGSR